MSTLNFKHFQNNSTDLPYQKHTFYVCLATFLMQLLYLHGKAIISLSLIVLFYFFSLNTDFSESSESSDDLINLHNSKRGPLN